MNKWIAKIGKLVLIILLLAAAFVYLAKDVQPKLHYQLQQPAFLSDSGFLHQHLTYPGGPAEYFSEFLMQFFMNNWTGALILVMLAFALSTSLLSVLNYVFGKSNFEYLVYGIPVIIIAALAGNYLLPLSIIVKIVLAAIFVVVFLVVKNNLIYKFPSFVVLAVLVYWFSGGVALYFFTITVLLVKLNQTGVKEKVIFTLFSLAITLIIPFVAYHFVFNISWDQAIFGLIPDRPVMLIYHQNYLIYLFLGAFTAIFLIENIYFLIIKIELSKYIKLSVILGQVIVLILIGYLLLKNSIDTRQKNELLVNYYAENEEWEKVIETAHNYKEYDYRINFEFNRALFHLGRLGEDLFSYPQLLGTETLFIDKNVAGSIAQMSSDLYFDLGHITESLRWAYEAQTLIPNSPRVLKRIIVGNIILGNYDAANVYIQLLNRNFRYKAWTKKYKDFINNPESTNTDSFITEKRKQLPKHVITPTNPVAVLEDLLKSDPKNKMAFEYLEAYHLFNHELKNFVKALDMIGNFEYTKFPKSFQEALLVYYVQTPGFKDDRFKFSNYTLDYFKDFSQILANAKGKKDQAKPYLYRYNDTYWYYALYLSPIVTKNQLKTKDGK